MIAKSVFEAPTHTTSVLEVVDNPDLEPPMDMQMSSKDISVWIIHQTGSHSQGDSLQNTHTISVGEYLWQIGCHLSSQVTGHLSRRELVLRTILVHKFSHTYGTPC